jgi:cell wall-associated NlpC family hydrolase
MTIPQSNHSGISYAFACVLASCLCVAACSSQSASARPNVLLVKLDSSTDPGAEIARRAMTLTGVRYKYGGTSPESGMDCSGLVRYVFDQTWGMDLPRTSNEISRVGRHIEMHDLQPGDLVFYNTLKRRFSHVGIYVGDNKFVHAPTAGGQVRVESMKLSYWKKRFDGARRISHPKRR